MGSKLIPKGGKMKKLLIAVLAFALFAPAFAVENVKITGDIQTIGLEYNDRGTTIGNNMRGTTNRVLFGIGADLVEDVYAKLTFAHGWYNGQHDLMGNNINDSSGDSLLENTYLAEAYVNISNVFDALEVKVGRQFYGDEKSAVMYLGPDYGYVTPNAYFSLDGARATYNADNFALTAAYFTVANLGSNPLSRKDSLNFGGLDLALKLSNNISADAYIYEIKGLPITPGHFGFWGVKPTIEYDHFKLGVEYARNFSVGNDKGWQVKADLALPMSTGNMVFTPRATYLKSEKNFIALGNYRPGLMFGTIFGAGLNNLIGPIMGGDNVANWEIINAGVCMKFANLEKWNFGLDFYTGEMDDMFMGNSWEAKVVYNHNEYVALNLTGAILTNAGHSWKHSPTAVQLGMNIKF